MHADNMDIVNVLREYGANVHAQDNKVYKAMDYIRTIEMRDARKAREQAFEEFRQNRNGEKSGVSELLPVIQNDENKVAQNDKNKMAQNDAVADKLKNAVESRAQGSKESASKTRAEVRKELHEVEVKKQQLVNSLRENDPEHETRQALAKKLKQIREDYSPAEALDVAKKNKSVQALREQLKAKGGTR